jgi:hypothetical protein
LAAAVRVKCRITSGFGLCRGHALEVKCVNRMGNVRFHDGEHLLLTLKRAHALKGFGDDTNMEMVARTVQVNDFDRGFWNGFEHLCFNPRRFNHDHASPQPKGAPSLNLRPNSGGSFTGEFLEYGVHAGGFGHPEPGFNHTRLEVGLEPFHAATADVQQNAVVLVDLA